MDKYFFVTFIIITVFIVCCKEYYLTIDYCIKHVQSNQQVLNGTLSQSYYPVYRSLNKSPLRSQVSSNQAV